MGRINFSWLVGLTGLMAMATGSLSANAFCRLTSICNKEDCNKVKENGCPKGTPVKWPTSCVSFSLQRDFSGKYPKDEMRALLLRAIDTWSQVTCPAEKFDCKDEASCKPSIKFVELPKPNSNGVSKGVTCRQSVFYPSLPNVNVIFFQDNKWINKNDGNVLARTTTKWNPDTADITDADMEINSQQIIFTLDIEKDPPEQRGPEPYDLQAIVTHELGHYLGLGHSKDSNATMYESYKKSQRNLTDDDIEGICTVYPPGSPDFCKSEPINGFSGDCADVPGGDSPATTSFCAASVPRPSSFWKIGSGAGFLLVVGGLFRWRIRMREESNRLI